MNSTASFQKTRSSGFEERCLSHSPFLTGFDLFSRAFQRTAKDGNHPEIPLKPLSNEFDG
jgi:hypothetical protein